MCDALRYVCLLTLSRIYRYTRVGIYVHQFSAVKCCLKIDMNKDCAILFVRNCMMQCRVFKLCENFAYNLAF